MGRYPPRLGGAGGFDGIASLLSLALFLRLPAIPRKLVSMLVSEKKDGDVIVLKDGTTEIRLHILREKQNGHMVLGIDAPSTVKISFPKQGALPRETVA